MYKQERQREENIFILIFHQHNAKGFAFIVILPPPQPCEINMILQKKKLKFENIKFAQLANSWAGIEPMSKVCTLCSSRPEGERGT